MRFDRWLMWPAAVGCCFAQAELVYWTPVSATVVETERRPQRGGATTEEVKTGKFYRDSSGRTRLEMGSEVIISDPIGGKTVVLDLANKTVRVTPNGSARASAQPSSFDAAVAAAASVRSAAAAPGPQNRNTDLSTGQTTPPIQAEPVQRVGVRLIEGIEAEGFRGGFIIPPGTFGNIGPVRFVSEYWRSNELRMPVLITSSSSRGVERSTLYKDVVANAEIDPTLFAIPPDFQVVVEAGRAQQ